MWGGCGVWVWGGVEVWVLQSNIKLYESMLKALKRFLFGDALKRQVTKDTQITCVYCRQTSQEM